jgi:hypothetical protein
MSKKYIIRTVLTAHEDWEVEANSPEEAYEMYKSGENLYHVETDVLYGSENKFHGIWEVDENGKWIGKDYWLSRDGSDEPFIKADDYVDPFAWRKEKSDE